MKKGEKQEWQERSQANQKQSFQTRRSSLAEPHRRDKHHDHGWWRGCDHNCGVGRRRRRRKPKRHTDELRTTEPVFGRPASLQLRQRNKLGRA